MNLPKHIIEERLATIRRMATEGRTLSEVAVALDRPRNNIRDLMARHGIELPPAWMPRPHRKNESRLPEGVAFMPDQVGDPSTLTEDEKDAAEGLGIPFDRAAWLLSCEYSGTAYGLRIIR